MTADEFAWHAAAPEAARLAAAARPLAATLPADGRLTWLDPDGGGRHTGPGLPPGFGERAWVPVKAAGEGALRPLFEAAQLVPTRLNAAFGGPTPLAGMLAGGLLGAGAGFAGGLAGEKLLGRKAVDPGRLRLMGALLGGAAGMAPGAYLGAVGSRLNAEDGRSPVAAWGEPNVLLGKQADAGGLFVPAIPVDAFNRVVWADPNTPAPLRAATAGLVDAAGRARGGAEVVSPFDVGRIAIGMGSGLASGMLVGKVLGALAGLTPEAQRTLQQTGMWAGAVRNVVPRAFGF